MIFINCVNEEIVQVNDKTRIDVSRSFVSGEELTDIEIRPSASDNFISVFSNDQDKWFLDWAYSTDGEQTITVRATDGSSNVVSQQFTITVVTAAADNLYSNDSQIFAIENELKRYIPAGRNSYNNIHREAQKRILNYLERKRIWKDDGKPYTKDQINLLGELNQWSLYETILIIYTDLFMSGGDKFKEKVKQYSELVQNEKTRASIRIDKNSDDAIDRNEIQDLKSFRMILRWLPK